MAAVDIKRGDMDNYRHGSYVQQDPGDVLSKTKAFSGRLADQVVCIN